MCDSISSMVITLIFNSPQAVICPCCAAVAAAAADSAAAVAAVTAISGGGDSFLRVSGVFDVSRT